MKTFYFLLLATYLPLVFLNAQTANTNMPDLNGDSFAAVQQGNYLYIGGSFTMVGSTTCNGLARINLTTNAVDNTWHPDISFFGGAGTVRAMAFSPDGATLYIGGDFDKVGGAAGTDRLNLAAIKTSDATPTTWDAPTNSQVKHIAVSSTGNIYVLGVFTEVKTEMRNGLVCITAAGNVTSFDPQCTNTNSIRELVISSDNSKVYLGFGNSSASFTDGMGGTVFRSQFAELDAITGVPTSFDPAPSSGVFAIIQTGTVLFLCGGFSTISGESRDGIAKYTDALGTPTLDATFVNGAKGTIRGAFYDGTNLYILGDFRKASSTYLTGLAKLNGTTGTAISTWRVGANKYGAPAHSKLRGSTSRSELYTVGYSGAVSFLGRTPRNFHVFNYASTNALAAETGGEASDGDTAFNFDFTGTSMVLNGTDALIFSSKYPLADRYTDAPQNVSGITESHVSNYRFVLYMSNISSTTKTLQFKLNDLPSPPSSPATTHIYYRNTPNEGAFTDAGTVTYNSGSNTLSIDASGLSNSSLIEFIFANNAVLPIEFSDFNVKKQDNTALIAWTTAHEDKGNRFEIQRSNNGVDFQTIHQLEAKGRATTYHFDDTQPLKNINYYRILSKNTEGVSKTTKTQSVQFSEVQTTIQVFPNPTTDYIFIQNTRSNLQFLTLTNTAGQIVLQREVRNLEEFVNLSHLPNGVYILKGMNTEGGVFSQKIIKR